MTDDEIISLQAKEIIELRHELEKMKGAISRAIRHMVCIGGPLNDNKLRYSPQQLVTFQRILYELE